MLWPRKSRAAATGGALVLPGWAIHSRLQNVVPSTLALVFAIGVGDVLTGVDIAFTMLYVFPIALGVWRRGRAYGFFLSLLSVAFGVAAEVYERRALSRPIPVLMLLWNYGGTVVIFAFGVELVHRLHGYVEREEREHRLTVEQLRHSERLNLIGGLAAGVAHELGTPLNVILGSADRIVSERANVDGIRDSVALIRQQTEKMTTIIRQLLHFGRQGARNREDVELGTLVRATTALLAPSARSRNVSLEVEAAAPVRVSVNPLEIDQVLTNLVVNAMQSMPEQGGVVRIATGVRVAGDGQRAATLAITDNGIGIASDVLPRIFDPFFTTKDVGEGTGLGLAVSYGIVRDHGGDIEVESERGRGTRVTVVLPFAP